MNATNGPGQISLGEIAEIAEAGADPVGIADELDGVLQTPCTFPRKSWNRELH